jgi:hypothetical protein
MSTMTAPVAGRSGATGTSGSSLGPNRPYSFLPLPPASNFDPNIQITTGNFFELQYRKCYIAGFLFKKAIVDPALRGTEKAMKEWESFYVELVGNALLLYAVPEIPVYAPGSTPESLMRIKATIKPTYIHVQDATVTWVGTLRKEVSSFISSSKSASSSDKHNCFAINTADAQRIYLQAPSEQAGYDWVFAIRLSFYENGKLGQNWSRELVHNNRYARDVRYAQNCTKLEEYIQIRYSGSTEWRKYWVTLECKVGNFHEYQSVFKVTTNQHYCLSSRMKRVKRKHLVQPPILGHLQC